MALPLRIAMWSGPRNISTALMRSWENRPDTVVCDEPLYAHYLEYSGVDHPGADEVVARSVTSWRKAVAFLTGPFPEREDGVEPTIFYQKHMAHHLVPVIGSDWLEGFAHALLIRDPREMLLSLAKITPEIRIEETGLPQQVQLFEAIERETGLAPPVIDARDVLENPRGMLQKLCEAFDVPFLEEMLSWPPGPRSTDGIWAKYWYADVEQSTGFAAWTPREGELSPALEEILEQCREPYERLHAERITV